MNNKNSILQTPRLSLTEAVANTYRSVMKQTEGVRTRANVRTVLAAAVMIAAGTIVVGSTVRYSHDSQRITDLENNIIKGDLSLALANTSHLDTELNLIRSASRADPTARQASLTQLTEFVRQIDAIERTLNERVPQISSSNLHLNNLLQRAQGKVIALRLKIGTIQSELEDETLRLSQTVETRTRLIHTDPLAVAMSDLQARILSCDHDSVQAACNGPLHGLNCYAFLPGTDNRIQCEAIKPICNRCNLR